MQETGSKIKIQMRKDLFVAYRNVTSKPCPTQTIAWYRTVRHPAPRYYICAKTAVEVLSPMTRGDYSRLERFPKHKQRMYLYLFEEVKRLAEKRSFQGKSLHFITSFAITQPAPEFFITSHTLRKMFLNAKRYGIDFGWNDAYKWNKQYTNRKDNKPKDAVYKGKLHAIIIK